MTTSAKIFVNDKVDKAMEGFASMMIEKLESMEESKWRQPWFNTTLVPMSVSGRRYNGMNTLLLMMAAEKYGYEQPIWGTFQAYTRLNKPDDKNVVKVKKGEHGVAVFITTFTVTNQNTGEKVALEEYNRLPTDEKADYKVVSHFAAYTVFNIAQTNLMEVRPDIYEHLTKGEQGHDTTVMYQDDALEAMLTKQTWLCPINLIRQDKAYYSISRDLIVLPTKEQFADGESFYGTLLHEMAHSTGVEKRLNRKMSGVFGDDSYAKEELIAELTAALVCSLHGMSKTIKADSIPYIRHWMQELGESPKFINTILRDVQRAAAMIENSILG